jgi:HEAT repeat protein
MAGQVPTAGHYIATPNRAMNPTPDTPSKDTFPSDGLAPDDGAVARRRAAALAGHAGDTATAVDLLTDPDAGVRVAALGALARCGAIDTGICARTLADPDPGVRRRLAEELGRTRPDDLQRREASVDTALVLLGDVDPAVAEAAAWALGELAGPAPDDDHEPHGHHEPQYNDSAGVAAGASASAGVAARSEVTDALADAATTHSDALVRESAVAALGAVGDLAGLPAVLAATGDKPAVRRRAVIALAAFLGQPGVTEALEQATTDRDWQVRQAADMLLDADDEPPGVDGSGD